MLTTVVRVLGQPLTRATPAARAADAIVVLGAPARVDGRPAAVAGERIGVGAALYRRGLAPILCVTGHRREAESMADLARAQGVPDRALRVEPLARNTRENALRTAELLLAEGLRTAWVVTQPFHLRRACYWFRRAGMDPLPWHDEASIQYRDPGRALAWITREYASWANLIARELAGSWQR